MGAATESAGDVLVRTLKRARDELRDLVARRHGWRRRKQLIDSEFDAAFQVDTGGVTHLSGLRIDSANRDEGIVHIAIDPGEMESALASLDFDLEAWTFVDLGSGKGRAVFIASARPFRRLVGVEFAPDLHRVSVDNLRRVSRTRARPDAITFVCGDAVEFDFPDDPLVLFLHHPFGESVMRRVAANAVASIARSPRDFHVLYANPFHADVWLDVGFSILERGSTYVLLAGNRAAGPSDDSSPS